MYAQLEPTLKFRLKNLKAASIRLQPVATASHRQPTTRGSPWQQIGRTGFGRFLGMTGPGRTGLGRLLGMTGPGIGRGSPWRQIGRTALGRLLGMTALAGPGIGVPGLGEARLNALLPHLRMQHRGPMQRWTACSMPSRSLHSIKNQQSPLHNVLHHLLMQHLAVHHCRRGCYPRAHLV